MRVAITLLCCLAFSLILAGHSVSDSLVQAFNSEKDDSLRVSAVIALFDELIDKYPDSIYLYINEALTLAKEAKLTLLSVNLQIKKGKVFDRLNNYVESQKIYFSTRKYLDSLRDEIPDTAYVTEYTSVINNLALVYYRTGKYEDARKYSNEAIQLLESEKDSLPHSLLGKLFTITYNNLGGIYLQTQDYEHAKVYYLKAFSYLEPDDRKSTATILNNLGIIENNTGNYDKSLDYLTRALILRRELGQVEGEIQCLNNLGHLFWKMGKVSQARDTIEKAYRMANENQYIRSQVVSMELLSNIYEELGNDKKALAAYRQFKVLFDSLMNRQNLMAITQLEMQQKFDMKMQDEAMKQKEMALKRQRNEAIYLSLIIVAMLLVSLFVTLYLLQRNKMKRQELNVEKDRLKRKSLELENDKLSMELDYKNKELTTNVIHLARTNEFIKDISQKLLKNKISFTRDNQRLIGEIIHDLQTVSDADTWKEFEIRFQDVHSDFYIKLNDQFPNLTSNEKKLCAFLRLNMTTKEISAITYQSITSITVARSRLRKKLGIEKDENLVSFLEAL